jgi:cytochrome c-type biogenesis protein CcmH
MKRAAAWLLLLCAALLAPLAWADAPPQPQPSPQQPQPQTVDPDRFYQLTSQLRCLVCQNESLADSDASLAIDLKNEIRARMAAGQSDAQIKKFLVDRYGNFVIYRPPFTAATLLLWLAPLLLVLIGILAMWRTMRAKAASGMQGDADGGAPDAADHGAEGEAAAAREEPAP